MKSCTIKLKFSLPRDTHKKNQKNRRKKLTMNYHDRLYTYYPTLNPDVLDTFYNNS